jgi:putative aldouronate transport system substrate-binding protein
MKLQRILALILIAALTSALAACGQPAQQATTAAATTTAATTAAETTAAATTAAQTTAAETETTAAETTTAAPTTTAVTTTAAPEPAAESAGKAMADKYGLPYSGMEDDPPITVTRFADASAVSVSPDNPFNVAMEAITNIKIEMEYLVGDPYEKIGVMVASGDLPDMVNVGVGEQPMLYQAGCYMPLQDLVEQYAPNYRNQFDHYWPYMFTSDGNKYIMSTWGVSSGTVNPITYNGCAFYIQKAVLDYYGRAPADINEYFEFIRGYKEAFPDINGVTTIGYEAEMADWRTWSLVHPSKFLNGYGNWGDAGVADMVNNVAFDPYIEPWYKDYIKKLNEEYHLGTILAETFTRDHDQFLATIASGAVLGMFDQEWNFNNAQDLLKQEGRFDRTYIPLGLTANSSIKPHYIDNEDFTANNGFGISAKSKYAERIMKLCNYVIQEDVQTWLSWGIEGEHYYVENGRYLRPDEQRALQTDPQWVRDNMGRWYRDLWPKVDGTFTNGNATGPATQNEESFASLTDYDKNLYNKLGIKSRIAFLGAPVDVPPYYPFWGKRTFNGDGSEADLLWNRSVEIVREALPLLVIAPADQFDAQWDAFQENYKKLDTKPLFDALNADINRWMSMGK